MIRTRFTLVVGLVCVAVVVADAPVRPAEGPMRNEDVVMMLVRDVAVEDVIERIRSSDPEFDLSEDMTRELRIAGVPDRVIAAMRARQSQVRGAAAKPDGAGGAAPAIEFPSRPKIRLAVVDLDRPAPATGSTSVRIRLPEDLPETYARALEIDADPASRRIGEVAVFLACTEPTHAPDHWRNHTPLGRDFVSTPRHRMLAFAPAAPHDPSSGRDGDATADHDLPADVEAEVEGNGHVLIAGIALEVGDRWYLLRSADLGTHDMPDDALDLALGVHTAGGPTLGVEVEAIPAVGNGP